MFFVCFWRGGLPLRQIGLDSEGLPIPKDVGPPALKATCYFVAKASPCNRLRNNSATGTRTRVARVRAEYPNQLDYSGL